MRVRAMVAVVAMGWATSLLAQQKQMTPAERMAATVIREKPLSGEGSESTSVRWTYEQGTLLDGMTAVWQETADGADFAYIKAAVDRVVGPDGTIEGYKPQGHTLDDIEMGRAVLVVYRVTQEPRYAKAAKFLHDQLALQPRTASGGYWHKQIYPNQMWLDGAYMAEPFRAMYAATFKDSADWDDIAKQLLLMDEHMHDPATGLLRHGWDESKQMPWADPKSGLSPEVWARALGWYGMALVDVLDWFPRDNPKRAALEDDLRRTMAAIVKAQDPASGLWWQVMTQPGKDKNYFEASASCMFTYALAKGVRKGYLPRADAKAAEKGWQGIQKHFITQGADGNVILHGTVKVGGLGGKAYRSGDFAYYVGEPVVDQDAKGVGAYLLAASEIDQAATSGKGLHKIAVMDGWYNGQTRADAFGGSHIFHYKWDTDSNEGDSFFGRALARYGVQLRELDGPPTAASLHGASIYAIVSPDTLAKNPQAHGMDATSAHAIADWVKQGGVLLLFGNDEANASLGPLNAIGERFGIHFNAVLSHHVVEPDHAPGVVTIPAGTNIFGSGFKAYMKDTCTLSVHAPAKALVNDAGATMVAVAHVEKGVVLAITDPWFYNEYADGRKMAQYQGSRAAQDVAAWAVAQAN